MATKVARPTKIQTRVINHYGTLSTKSQTIEPNCILPELNLIERADILFYCYGNQFDLDMIYSNCSAKNYKEIRLTLGLDCATYDILFMYSSRPRAQILFFRHSLTGSSSSKPLTKVLQSCSSVYETTFEWQCSLLLAENCLQESKMKILLHSSWQFQNPFLGFDPAANPELTITGSRTFFRMGQSIQTLPAPGLRQYLILESFGEVTPLIVLYNWT